MFLLPTKNRVFHILVRAIVTEKPRKAKSVTRTKGQLTHTRERGIPKTLIISNISLSTPLGDFQG